MQIYSAPSYGMGLDVAAAATAPITTQQAQLARAELSKMRRALTRWLHYRQINDAVAAGQARQVPNALLKRPGAQPPPAAVAKLANDRARRANEETLALHLHQLLSEVFDAGTLPSPNLNADPNAAVKLAAIAISGKLPGEQATPTATGFIWLWPAVIVVGAIALVLTTMIRSNAEIAMDRERTECIKAGKCTDSGFWLKVGAVAVVGWFVWDKAGLRERVTGALGKRKAAGR
jgi:hypothetical protein